jgi:hypothetical protein
LLDLLSQRLKRQEVVQVGLLLFALLPELFQWVGVWRLGRHLDDLQPKPL